MYSRVREALADYQRDFFLGYPDVEDDFPFLYTRVAAYGGEGMGEEYWKVYKFQDKATNECCTVKFDGYYMSYEGSTFEEIYEVMPVEKTITVWEKK